MIDNLFSIKNEYYDDKKIKIIKIFGIKIKFSKTQLNNHINELDNRLDYLEEIVSNIEYEFADKYNLKADNMLIPQIMTIDETLDEIINKKLSVCRFGDGEFKYMLGEKDLQGIYFGTLYSEKLQNRLLEVIRSNDSNCLICLWDFWGNLEKYNEFHKKIARYHMKNIRNKVYKYLDFNRKYGNSFISRPYLHFTDKSNSKAYFEKIKRIWQDRDVVIVEGNASRLGVGNDLFNNVTSLQRIICPAENAFQKYDEILEETKKISKDKLIIIALGMSATILAYDLAKIGFQAIDMGHVDIEYEWFLRGSDKPEIIESKYVNDVGYKTVEQSKDLKYLSEILKEIK